LAALGKEKNHVKLDESNVWLQNQFSTSYGLSKYLGELEVWRGAAEGLNVSVILPSVILGIGDWHRSSLQMVDRIANHSPWYPGGQTGFVDARDVANFTGLILEKGMIGDRWILNGANLSYKEIFGKIAGQLGLKKKFRLSPKWFSRMILFTSNIKSGTNICP
jgi:nucleoside-diphosphate-sugar epimerase